MKSAIPTLFAAATLLVAFHLFSGRTAAEETNVASIRFADHHFTPQTLTVTAGEPLAVKVINSSNETIEFESFKLNREVAMTPGETITVRLPPLRPGTYDFYDDFHQDVPEGSIIAK